MGLQRFTHNVSRGLQNATGFLGNAYSKTTKFLSGLDNYAGIARSVVGELAPLAGSMTGPIGTAVGAAVGGGMKALGTYDRLKAETMAQGNQLGNVAAAAKRGIG